MAEFVGVPLLVIAFVAAATVLAVAFGAARRCRRRSTDSSGDGSAYPYNAQGGKADDGDCGGD